jgi:dienelactone hydrolase
MKRILILTTFAIALSVPAYGSQGTTQDAIVPPELVSFPTQDGGLVFANLYGKGNRGVVLAHGGRFNKESWEQQARALVKAGFRVLAIDFRGFGQSKGPGQTDLFSAPLHYDVLAAVRYLRKAGAKTVSVVGGSLGGGAAADATIEAEPGEIECLVVLGGAAGNGPPEKQKGRKLFIIARHDANADGPRLPKTREQYEKIPQPKELVILDGSAHAQFLFQTDQGERVMREILRFLSEESPPELLLIVQEELKPQSVPQYARLETNIARECVRLQCPHPYLALESVTQPKVVWWLNAFPSSEEKDRVEQAWQRNEAAMQALRTLSRGKKALTRQPITYLTRYREDLSNAASWKMGGTRFFVVHVAKENSPSVYSVFEAPDGRRFVFAPVGSHQEADRQVKLAGPRAQVLAVQPRWSLPAEAWIAADPEFWKSNPRAHGK